MIVKSNTPKTSNFWKLPLSHRIALSTVTNFHFSHKFRIFTTKSFRLKFRTTVQTQKFKNVAKFRLFRGYMVAIPFCHLALVWWNVNQGLKSSHKNRPPSTPCYLCVLLLWYCLPRGLGWVKPRGVGHSQNGPQWTSTHQHTVKDGW